MSVNTDEQLQSNTLLHEQKMLKGVSNAPQDNHQVQLIRLEPALYLFLIVHGVLVLAGHANPLNVWAGLMLFGVNLLSILLTQYTRPSTLFLRGIFATCISGYLSLVAVDPAHSLLAWFYLLIVFYSFALAPPYQTIVILFIPSVFTFTTMFASYDSGFGEFVARLSLMLLLGVLMGYVRAVVERSVIQRRQLMDDLRQARDNYAQQLDARTAELETEIQERKQAQSKLAEERQLLQTVVDTFPSRLYVKDRNSRFIMVNRWSLKRLGLEDNPTDIVGMSDFDFYPHFAQRTYNDEQHLMETGEPIIDVEETTIDEHGVERHYLISKVPMYHSESQEIVGLVGVTTEVTSLKQTQIALQESEESLKLFQLRLKALNQITINLTRIETFDQLVYESIKQAVDYLGFGRLSCWFIDPDNSNQLLGGYMVDRYGEIVSTRNRMMKPDTTHPAYVIMNGIEPNYIARDCPLYDIEFNPIGHGDKAFTALLDGEKVIGCLYTDTLFDKQPLSQSQIELLNLYGATLGVLFNRQRAEEALKQREEETRHFQQQLKLLNEITVKLESIDTLDEVCRQVIILGREKLGFERLGIWLTIDDQPKMRRGMWGTDMQGQLRDERSLVSAIPDTEASMVSEGEVYANFDIEIFEPDQTFVGRGWALSGLMWDGTKRIGWLFADNGLDGQPLTDSRYEIFRLYVATIGLICGRRIADDELRQSEIRYRAITEASSDVITIVNRELIVTYISPSLKSVMGIDPQTIVGKSISQLIHPDNQREASDILQHCFQFPRLNTRMNEFRVRHAQGHWVHMEAVITSMIDDPIINGAVISCRDLTQRLIAEEGKRIFERERERAQVLRQFIGDISHDFRTPLSTISSNAYLIRRGSSERIEHRTTMIDQQVERLANLISNLNMITKLDEINNLSMERLNINRILETIPHDRQRIAEEKMLNIQLDLQIQLPLITGNTSLLHDAIYHLVDNAIQFCPKEGTIVIQSYADDAYVSVQIADTGIGIPQDDLPYVFDRMYRADKARNTHTGGSGLGLAITRRIIELHQGAIKITSEVNEGTLVHLRFPTD